MTLGRICLTLALAADLRTGEATSLEQAQRNTQQVQQQVDAKRAQAQAQLGVIQRQLAVVDATAKADFDDLKSYTAKLDQEDDAEEAKRASLHSGMPSSFVETSPSLVQQNAKATQKATQAARAKASAKAHAHLASIQKQMSAVTEKMHADMANLADITRAQDDDDLQQEMPGASSFIELPESTRETRAAAHAKLAATQKELAAINSRMQDDMATVTELAQNSIDVSPSSFAEMGRKTGYSQLPANMQSAMDKLHSVEDQMRRMDQGFKTELGTEEYPSSLLQTPDDTDRKEHIAELLNQLDADKLKAKRQLDVNSKRREHMQKVKSEFRASDGKDDEDDDEDSLLEIGATKKQSVTDKAKAAMGETGRTLAEVKAFLETAMASGQGTPKVEEALKRARQHEKAWEKQMHASNSKKLKDFDEAFNAHAPE